MDKLKKAGLVIWKIVFAVFYVVGIAIMCVGFVLGMIKIFLQTGYTQADFELRHFGARINANRTARLIKEQNEAQETE